MFLDLGGMPLVNEFLPAGSDQESFPLRVGWCDRCYLVQLLDIVPPERLFRHYQHLSSAAPSNVKHLEGLAASLIDTLHPGTVLEIGSNDGSLLRHFTGSEVLGVDPALNIETQVPTVREFMSTEVARRILDTRGKFDLVLALNVVAHTPDVLDLLRAVKMVLASDGTFVMETVDVSKTILRGQFDTVYHEHVYCFSLPSLHNALKTADLRIVGVEEIPTQGGSLRVFIKHSGGLDAVVANGMSRFEIYERVGDQAERIRGDLLAKIVWMKGRIVGLGASARGTVIANYCGLDRVLDCVVDDTPLKQGMIMPGTGIPVVSLEDAGPADGYVCLAWNYAADFRRRIPENAQMLVPMPEVRFV